MVLLDVNLILFSPLNHSIVYPKPARNLPIGGVALAMVMLFVKQKLSKQAKDIRSLPPLQRLKRMDWAGTIIFLGAFISGFTMGWTNKAMALIRSHRSLHRLWSFTLSFCIYSKYYGRKFSHSSKNLETANGFIWYHLSSSVWSSNGCCG